MQADRSEIRPRQRRRWWLDVVIVVAAFVAVQAFLSRDVVRGPLPPLEGLRPDGAVLSAERWQREQDGDAYMLYVWASWCAVCKIVEGSVDALAGDAPLLTIAMQSGNGIEVGRFLDARGLHWPTLVDTDARLARDLGVGAVPTLIFVGRDGRVRAVTRGYTTEIGMRLRLWWARRAA